MEGLLEEHISSNEWYFVPTFNMKPANFSHWKFDSLVVFVFKKSMNDKLWGELAIKSLIKLRQNQELFWRTDVDEKEIKFCYYYDDVESFDCEKEASFLKAFLIATKFEKRNWSINPTVGVFHFSFNYSELVCNKSYNFVTRFDIRKL